MFDYGKPESFLSRTPAFCCLAGVRYSAKGFCSAAPILAPHTTDTKPPVPAGG